MIRFALIVAIYYSSADVERVGIYNNIDQCEKVAKQLEKDIGDGYNLFKHSCIPVYE
jgi:hypothetical protein